VTQAAVAYPQDTNNNSNDRSNVDFNQDVANATPMMQQFFAIKQEHQDYLLFYRMGDFYELFFHDAIIAVEVLDIALTHRGKHAGEPIPMCGVPYHSSEQYLHRLIKSGYKVAVCEQMEDPKEAKKRGSKAVVHREVTRIITPGTLTEDSLLEARSANYLCALASNRQELAIAWLDISTGEFCTLPVTKENLTANIARIEPQEILLPAPLLEDDTIYRALSDWKALQTTHVSSFFESGKGERKLKLAFNVSSIEAFGNFTRPELGACGALLEYLELTQKGSMPRLQPPRQTTTRQFMGIDAATRRNLELTHTLTGSHKGSLMNMIDRTVTSPGTRLLAQFIATPLLDSSIIASRQDVVSFLIDNESLRTQLRDTLKKAPDMERALSRLHLKRGTPADLTIIRDGLAQALTASQLLESIPTSDIPEMLKNLRLQLGCHDELRILLQQALTDTVAIRTNEGGYIREGFDPKLDEFRNTGQEANILKDELRDKYSSESGIPSLKIKTNNVLGMFIEVTPQNSSKVPDYFVHRQTLAGQVRYTTPELRELEHKIVNAKGYALSLEVEIFEKLCALSCDHAQSLSATAQSLASLDVFAALSEIAKELNYSRPKVDNSNAFSIVGGRHPVVEQVTEDSFIPNDCDMSQSQKLWLITGPNMAGKSTFLRQNALLTILAQTGCFVPADSAHIGIVDQVFSRVGAADDLARGRSTFMVEMVETATILNQATEKSLVILDEIGRGTATFDGLSIAWAVVEHIHDVISCRGLFATHYHELTSLVSRLKQLSCHTVKVKEWKGDVIFLHQVVPGVADRSYGIHVGKLAGLPRPVLKRAEEVLKVLETGDNGNAIARLAEDLPLFSHQPYLTTQEESENSTTDTNDSLSGNDKKIFLLLKELQPDSMTPREALDALYKLKDTLEEADS